MFTQIESCFAGLVQTLSSPSGQAWPEEYNWSIFLCSAYINSNEILSNNQDLHFMKNIGHINESFWNKIVLMEVKSLKK